jgi:protein MPE1
MTMNTPYFVRFKFKSEKKFQYLRLPGNRISLFDVKCAMVASARLNKGKDFDLAVSNADTGEEYTNDDQVIPANISIVVKRMPVIRRGGGLLAKIKRMCPAQAAPGMVNSDWQDGYTSSSSMDCEANSPVSEEEGLQRLLEAANTRNTAAAQSVSTKPQQMRYHEYIDTTKIPPAHYLCKRCSKAGHYIQHCPTNGDPEYDFKRYKRILGIPTTLLNVVDDSKDGCLVDAMGRRVTMNINRSAFAKLTERACHLPTDVQDSIDRSAPDFLRCPICTKLVQDAVLIPCCQISACDECIREELFNRQMQCPLCANRHVTSDQLIPNKSLRSAATVYFAQSADAYKASHLPVADHPVHHEECPTEESSSAITESSSVESVDNDTTDDDSDEFGTGVY